VRESTITDGPRPPGLGYKSVLKLHRQFAWMRLEKMCGRGIRVGRESPKNSNRGFPGWARMGRRPNSCSYPCKSVTSVVHTVAEPAPRLLSKHKKLTRRSVHCIGGLSRILARWAVPERLGFAPNLIQGGIGRFLVIEPFDECRCTHHFSRTTCECNETKLLLRRG